MTHCGHGAIWLETWKRYGWIKKLRLTELVLTHLRIAHHQTTHGQTTQECMKLQGTQFTLQRRWRLPLKPWRAWLKSTRSSLKKTPRFQKQRARCLKRFREPFGPREAPSKVFICGQRLLKRDSGMRSIWSYSPLLQIHGYRHANDQAGV